MSNTSSIKSSKHQKNIKKNIKKKNKKKHKCGGSDLCNSVDTTYVYDPYCLDINNEKKKVWLCENCFQEISNDI